MQEKSFDMYLTNIKDMFPCKSCLVIGSGSGSYIDTLEELNFQDVILVEADEQQIEKMYKMHDVSTSYLVENTLIYKDDEAVTFNIATNSTVNCFKSIEIYQAFMPNVSLLESKELRSYSLDSFLQSLKDKEVNWLIIDTFTSLEILGHAKNSLEVLEVIVCKTFSDTSEALHSFMLDNNFIRVKSFEENNPKVKVPIYIKDYKNQNPKNKTIKTELNQKIESLKKELVVSNTKVKDLAAQLASKKTAFEKQLQVEQSKTKTLIEINTKENIELNTSIEILKKNQQHIIKKELALLVDENKLLHIKLKDTTNKMEEYHKLSNKRKDVINNNHSMIQKLETKIDTAIDKRMNILTDEIELYIALQNSIIHNMPPIHFYNWTIKADFALLLSEKLKENRYDLIVEFGSGMSTILLGTLLKNKKYKTKLISFEHNKMYYDETLKKIRIYKLSKYIDLVYTPLTEYVYEKNKFLYYNCNRKLNEIKHNFSNNIKSIMVIVDGPPGSTGNIARFPALTHILNIFSDKSIDIFLDDYKREQEKLVVEEWILVLKKTTLSFSKQEIESIKGTCVLQISKKGIKNA